MYFSLTSSFWYSVTELDIYPQTWKSIFDKQVLSFKFISYLYGMKANTKPLCDLYYKNSFHKRKQNMKKWEKWHESKQMLHKKYGVIKCSTLNRFITFSGHFISFEDWKSFGAEIAAVRNIPINRQFLYRENKVLRMMVVGKTE